MNTIEQRLTDALNARADLVTPESLTPSEPPAPVVPLRRRFPRPAGYAIAAAACAAAVAAPFVIPALTGGDAGKQRDVPPVVEIGVDWPVLHRASFDMDGDRRPDRVLLKNDPADPERARVDVELAAGGTPGVVFPTRGLPVSLGTPVGADGQAGLDVTVVGEHAELVALLVFREGDLREATGIDPVEFAFELDAESHTHHWWVNEDRLYSGTSVDAFEGQLPVTYAVDVRHWVVTDNLELRPRGQAVRLCTDKAEPTGFPETCDRADAGPDTSADDGFADGASPFLDRNDAVIHPGEQWIPDNGNDPTRVGLEVADGGYRLMMTVDNGFEVRADLTPPAGVTAEPVVHMAYATGRPGGAGLIVVQWGFPGGPTQLYANWEGALKLIPFTDSYGQNQSEGGGSVSTVLTTDGTLYALVQSEPLTVDVYRWEYQAVPEDDTAYMVLGNSGMALGTWCTNEVDPDLPPYVEC